MCTWSKVDGRSRYTVVCSSLVEKAGRRREELGILGTARQHGARRWDAMSRSRRADRIVLCYARPQHRLPISSPRYCLLTGLSIYSVLISGSIYCLGLCSAAAETFGIHSESISPLQSSSFGISVFVERKLRQAGEKLTCVSSFHSPQSSYLFFLLLIFSRTT